MLVTMPNPRANRRDPRPIVQADGMPSRNDKGQWLRGVSGNSGGQASRARQNLNADTIREMHAAFRRGGRKAIEKVMTQQPAVFLKLLVLLVPRELEVTHSAGVKGLTDDQLEQAIGAIEEMLSRRGADAKLIEGTATETVDPNGGKKPKTPD